MFRNNKLILRYFACLIFRSLKSKYRPLIDTSQYKWDRLETFLQEIRNVYEVLVGTLEKGLSFLRRKQRQDNI